MKFKIFDKYSSIEHIVTEKNLNLEYSFSMALHTGEEKTSIISNRVELKKIFGDQCSFASTLQTHSDMVHIVNDSNSSAWEGKSKPVEADALITNLPSVALTILTADCVPILLYDPVSKAIGAIHAGWRGAHNNIILKTINKMQETYGTNPRDIIAGIGPSIGGCCYEVGIEVAEKFMEYVDSVEKNKNGKYQLDLKSICNSQLLGSGLQSYNIEKSSICTACQSSRFFSYRKEQGCSGRFVSALAMMNH
ncbi:MAG TPA: peptidoglycan editing factor PgeF [Sulfurovum sp.]|nr:peptidoglycan editing factor PgeF [Sulfurovum sp.]